MKAERSKTKSRYSLLALGLAACPVAFGFIVYAAPPYSFHPLCTYRTLAEVTAKISVSGEVHSSSVVHQASHSRLWIATMNSGGCKSTHGMALSFKLDNGNVVLLPSAMCKKAEKELKRRGSVDIVKACDGRRRPGSTVFFIDSADHPQTWRNVSSKDKFQVIEMTATSTWQSPSDNLDRVAPNILKSRFDTGGSWARSPEKVLAFARRYSPTKTFAFDVKNEQF